MEPMKPLKKKKNIANLIIWFLTMVTFALLSGVPCFISEYEQQFVDAVVFGYFIVMSLVVAAIFLEEDFPNKTMIVLCFFGMVLYFITAILFFVFLEEFFSGIKYFDHYKGRVMAAMILSFFLGFLFLIEFAIILLKPDAFN